MVEFSSSTACQLAPEQGGLSCDDARRSVHLSPDIPKVPMLSRSECAARQGEYVRGRLAWNAEMEAFCGEEG